MIECKMKFCYKKVGQYAANVVLRAFPAIILQKEMLEKLYSHPTFQIFGNEISCYTQSNNPIFFGRHLKC